MHTLAGRHIWASCGAWTNIIPQQKCYISQLCIISAVTGERKRERSKKNTQAVDAAYIISYLAICNVCCASDGDGRTAFCAGQSDSIKNKFFLYMKMLYVRQYKYEKHEAALLALHVDMWLCDCDMFTMYVCACCMCVCVCWENAAFPYVYSCLVQRAVGCRRESAQNESLFTNASSHEITTQINKT